MPSGVSVNKCPCQELNLVLDLRRVACESATPQGQAGHRLQTTDYRYEVGITLPTCGLSPVICRLFQVPRRGVEPRPAASNAAVLIRHTRGARLET
jgi:hypothetical protein